MNETVAKFFYEQCAGTTSGHMAMVPNNQAMFTLVRAYSGHQDDIYAATSDQFAAMLREMADALDNKES